MPERIHLIVIIRNHSSRGQFRQDVASVQLRRYWVRDAHASSCAALCRCPHRRLELGAGAVSGPPGGHRHDPHPVLACQPCHRHRFRAARNAVADTGFRPPFQSGAGRALVTSTDRGREWWRESCEALRHAGMRAGRRAGGPGGRSDPSGPQDNRCVPPARTSSRKSPQTEQPRRSSASASRPDRLTGDRSRRLITELPSSSAVSFVAEAVSPHRRPDVRRPPAVGPAGPCPICPRCGTARVICDAPVGLL
jgi:hypothetical protein